MEIAIKHKEQVISEMTMFCSKEICVRQSAGDRCFTHLGSVGKDAVSRSNLPLPPKNGCSVVIKQDRPKVYNHMKWDLKRLQRTVSLKPVVLYLGKE